MRREPSEVFKRSNGAIDKHMRLNGSVNGHGKGPEKEEVEHKQAGLPQLVICIGGIYMSLYVGSSGFS
jgi:UDP-galactose transporter B1